MGTDNLNTIDWVLVNLKNYKICLFKLTGAVRPEILSNRRDTVPAYCINTVCDAADNDDRCIGVRLLLRLSHITI